MIIPTVFCCQSCAVDISAVSVMFVQFLAAVTVAVRVLLMVTVIVVLTA